MSGDTQDAPAKTGEPTPKRDFLGFGVLVRDLLHLDRAALAVLVGVPVCLTLLEYYGMPWHWSRYRQTSSPARHRAMELPEARVPPVIEDIVNSVSLPGDALLHPYMWWGIGCAVCLILLPLLIGRVFAGMGPRQLGLRLKGTLHEAPTYLALYLLFLPVVFWVSRWPGFQATYPFFGAARKTGPDANFWTFEAIYCLQFLGIELFFRGFMVLGLKRALGRGAILAMLAPYCMIHYYKPLPEAMGAIGAGLILGSLSYRSGTVIYGWLLHFAVALSMDLFALQAMGAL